MAKRILNKTKLPKIESMGRFFKRSLFQTRSNVYPWVNQRLDRVYEAKPKLFWTSVRLHVFNSHRLSKLRLNNRPKEFRIENAYLENSDEALTEDIL